MSAVASRPVIVEEEEEEEVAIYLTNRAIYLSIYTDVPTDK